MIVKTNKGVDDLEDGTAPDILRPLRLRIVDPTEATLNAKMIGV